MLSVQRDDNGQPPSPAADSASKPGELKVEAHEVPPPSTATATPTATGAPAPSGGPQPGGDPPAQRQFQVQYAFQGQAVQATGPGVARGQGSQLGAAHQLTVQLNVSHHDNDHAGREESYAVQGVIDPAGDQFLGATAQVQEALVSATRHHLQGQVFGNASAGMGADSSGRMQPLLQAGLGAQGSLVINDHFQVWVQAQDQVGLSAGPGNAGSRGGATVSNAEQASAGFTVSF